MNLLATLRDWWHPKPAVRAPVPAAGNGASGRPTYAPLATSTLSRSMSFTLLQQFYRSIPACRRAVEILAGFAGTPQFVCQSDVDTDDLVAWCRNVPYGKLGQQGLALWMKDHLSQALTYGFGVGEMVSNAQRSDIERLWSYASPAFQFRSSGAGDLDVVQSTGIMTATVLDPLTVLVTTHDPEGCEPQGRSLFWTMPTFAQTWLDVVHAHRATWRRSGIPIYHVNIQLSPETNDPDGAIATAVIASYEASWNEVMRSAVMDGRAKDFFSCGNVTVTALGADAAVMDIEVSKRAIVEELVVATGIPPFLLGYSWSSTERMSKQQADALMSSIDVIRVEATGTLRKLIDLRQRLAGRRTGLAYEIRWPDVTLQDMVETARAALTEAQAQATRQKTYRQLWTDGVVDQAGYAEAVTGQALVVVAMDEPPSAPVPALPAAPPGTEPGANGLRVSKALLAQIDREERAEYPDWARCECGGH